jgi:hypothetical protein
MIGQLRGRACANPAEGDGKHMLRAGEGGQTTIHKTNPASSLASAGQADG